MQTLIEKLEAATEGSRELDVPADLQNILAQSALGMSVCVLWPRKLDSRGRGRIMWRGSIKLAHRWVWEMLNGPIPDGMLLCHHCDNPTCVNTAHLYVGTHADNMKDARERGRTVAALYPEVASENGVRSGRMNTWTAGEGNAKAKLRAGDVLDIRASDESTRALAKRYGVHRTTIQRARSGAQWQRLRAREQMK